MTSSMRAMGALTMVSLLRSCRAFVPAAPLRLSGTLSSELVPSRTTRKSFGCHVLARARPVTMLALPDDMRQNQRKQDGRGYGERVGIGEGRLVGARGKATMSAAAVASGTVSRAPATSSTTLEQVGHLLDYTQGTQSMCYSWRVSMVLRLMAETTCRRRFDFRVCGELGFQDSWMLFGCCVS